MTLRRPRLTPRVRRLVKLGVPGVIAGGITQINIVIGTMIASLRAGRGLLPLLRRPPLPAAARHRRHRHRRRAAARPVAPAPRRPRRSRRPQPEPRRRIRPGADAAGRGGAVRHGRADHRRPLRARQLRRRRHDRDRRRRSPPSPSACPPSSLVKVFSPGFFAREDTRTPMWFAGISVVVNVAVSLALFPFLAHVGIAIATAVVGLGQRRAARRHAAPPRPLHRRRLAPEARCRCIARSPRC